LFLARELWSVGQLPKGAQEGSRWGWEERAQGHQYIYYCSSLIVFAVPRLVGWWREGKLIYVQVMD
jgi:ligand-binding sensor protein